MQIFQGCELGPAFHAARNKCLMYVSIVRRVPVIPMASTTDCHHRSAAHHDQHHMRCQCCHRSVPHDPHPHQCHQQFCLGNPPPCPPVCPSRPRCPGGCPRLLEPRLQSVRRTFVSHVECESLPSRQSIVLRSQEHSRCRCPNDPSCPLPCTRRA